MRTRLLLALASLALLPGSLRGGEKEAAARVSFLEGAATRERDGRGENLALGDSLVEGDLVETARRTRLELALLDGSVVRLGPSSRARLETAVFGKTPEERRFAARLLVGNVWAKVAKAVGGEARFEVRTDAAVAGVRGTTFRVDAAHDRSVVVRVYSGTVAVAGGGLPRPEHEQLLPRREVPGPSEVTKEEWERIVTTMMEVRVSASGEASEPRSFALRKDDDFESFNRARDLERR